MNSSSSGEFAFNSSHHYALKCIKFHIQGFNSTEDYHNHALFPIFANLFDPIMIEINIVNESSQLVSVILGTAQNNGPTPSLECAYDPKSRAHILAGTYPVEADMVREMESVVKVFEKYGVKVYRPQTLENVNQIFSRDIAFVVDNKFFIPNVLEERQEEFDAIKYIVEQVVPDSVVEMPADTRTEGGDVMPWNDYLFVGYSEAEDFEKYTVSRTNRAGLDFLTETFPNKKVIGFELNKSDTEPKDNALHLDCCFQPIGENEAIIYPGGFKNASDVEKLRGIFGNENLIEITRDEMYQMCSNVFSISNEVIISEKGFTRLNAELRKRGYIVEEVAYSEISKQEGLLRCSTMPLQRK